MTHFSASVCSWALPYVLLFGLNCQLSIMLSCEFNYFENLLGFFVLLSFGLHIVLWLELSMSPVFTLSSASWSELSLMLSCEFNYFENLLDFFIFLSFGLRTILWLELSMSSVLISSCGSWCNLSLMILSV